MTIPEKNEHVIDYIQSNILDQYDDLVILLNDLQSEIICDDYRSVDQDQDLNLEEYDIPAMDITIATNDHGNTFAYQTGDNSYSGSCYSQPHWSVNTIYKDTDTSVLAKELLNELIDTVLQFCAYY